jgi:hypothetical protein
MANITFHRALLLLLPQAAKVGGKIFLRRRQAPGSLS